MQRITKTIVHFLKREDGPTAVECALMLALVVVICIVAINIGSPTSTEPTGPRIVEISQGR